jgi:hypothetical protein
MNRRSLIRAIGMTPAAAVAKAAPTRAPLEVSVRYFSGGIVPALGNARIKNIADMAVAQASQVMRRPLRTEGGKIRDDVWYHVGTGSSHMLAAPEDDWRGRA